MPVSPESVSLFNALPTPHVLLSPTFVIEAVSESFLQTTLTQREDLVGHYIFDIFPDDPRTPEASGSRNFLASLQQVLATKQPHRIAQQPYAIPDPLYPGQFIERHWQAFSSPVLDALGHVQHIIHTTVDVTAEVQAQALLLESQAAEQQALAEAERQRQRFHEVLMQLPAHVAVYQGPDHVYQFVNPAYQRVLPLRSFVGRPFREAMPESIELGVVALFDQVYQSGEPYYGYELEGWFDFKGTGQLEQLFFDLLLHPLRDAQGRIDGVLDFSYNVTEQVRSRQQVEQLNQTLEARVQERTREVHGQQAELRRLFAQAPMAIVVLRGPEFIIEQANEQAELIWGRPAAEVLGRPHFEAIADVAGQGFEELLAGVLQTGEPVVLYEVPASLNRAHTGKPNTGYYSIIFKPLYDVQQQVNGIAVMWTEQTDQVLARQQVLDLNQKLAAINDELSESNRQLTRTNVDLDTFVYTASHDLKAPITNIESIALALRATLPSEVQQDEVVAHLLDLLNQTVARFQFTIAQLTDLSKLQLAHAGSIEPVNLATVLEGVCLDLAPALTAADTQLTVAVAPELMVSFSPANLRSVVYNLLSNAVKYRAPDRPSQVHVQATPTAEGIVLDVQDNGLGMSEVQQRQLFGLFQRLHTHVEGTGVGLYISKRLIENAGGTITVRSQPQVGTTFSVTFPR